MKSLKSILFVLLCLAGTSAFAQTITPGNVGAGPYTPGSDLTVPITFSGPAMAITETIVVYLSDKNGSFAVPGRIGEFPTFYSTFVNTQLIGDTSDGTGYKVKVIRSSQANVPGLLTAALAAATASNSFTIKTGTAINVSTTITDSKFVTSNSDVYRTKYDENATFSIKLNAPNGSTTTATLKNEITGASTTHTFASTNSTLNFESDGAHSTLKLTTTLGGNVATKSYLLINNPQINSLSVASGAKPCLPITQAEMIINTDPGVGGIGKNYPGTYYNVDWSDSKEAKNYTFQQLKADGGRIKSNYEKSSCLFDPANGYPVKSIPTNHLFTEDGQSLSTFVKVSAKSTTKIQTDTKVCVNQPATFENKTVLEGDAEKPGCLKDYTFSWYDGATKIGETKNNDPFTYTFTTKGEKTITVKGTASSTCDPDDFVFKICAEQAPLAKFTTSKASPICTNEVLTITDSSTTDNTCSEKQKREWSVTPNAGWQFTGGTDAASTDPKFNFTEANIYTITLKIPGNFCADAITSTIVTVNTPPKISMSANANVCTLDPLTFGPNSGITTTAFSGTAIEVADTYTWAVTGGTFSFTSGNANSKFPTIKFNEYKSYTVSVTHKNNCATLVQTQTLTFLNAPKISAGNDIVVCSDVSPILTGVQTGTSVSVQWLGGAGNFNPSRNQLITTYTPTAAEKAAGTVTLTLRANTGLATPCNIIEDEIKITIREENLITSSATKTICSGESIAYTPTAPVAGSTFAWTASVTSGAASGFTSSGTGAINDVLTNVGATPAVVTYVIKATANGCEGAPFSFKATVNPIPVLSTTSYSDTICNNASPNIQMASTVANTTYTWTSVASAGITGNTNNNNTTGKISDLLVNSGTVAGTVTYTITPSVNGCVGLPKILIITVNPTAVVANAGPNQRVCSTSMATLAGNSALNNVGTWTLTSGQADVVISNPNSEKTTVTGLVNGETYIFKWTIDAAPCAASSSSVTIEVYEIENNKISTTAKPTICSGESVTITGTAPTGGTFTYVWRQSTNDGLTWTSIAGQTGKDLTIVPTTTTLYRRNVNNGSCQNSSEAIKITVQGAISNTISLSGSPCEPGLITGNTPSGGTGSFTYAWQKSEDNGATWSIIPGATGQDFTPNAISVITKYQRLVLSGTCATNTSVAVTQNPVVTLPNAGTDENICLDGTPFFLKGNQPAYGTGKWTKTAGGGTITFVNDTQYNTRVNGMIAGQTYKFVWTIGDGASCTKSDEVEITTSAPSTVTSITSVNTTTVCKTNNSGRITLGGVLGTVSRWESSTDGTTWTSIANTTPTLDYSALTVTTKYRGVVKSGVCDEVKSAILEITVKDPPPVANAGLDQVLCNSTRATLNAVSAGSYQGKWTEKTGNAVTISNPNQNITTVTGLKPGIKYIFEWEIKGAPCDPTADSVTIIVERVESNTISVASNEVCEGNGPITISGSIAKLASGVTNISYLWESSSNGTTWTAIAPASANPNITITPTLGDMYYRRSASEQGGDSCLDISESLKITTFSAISNTIIDPVASCEIKEIVGNAPSGGGSVGAFTFRWEQSVNSGPWTNIDGATQQNYTPATNIENTKYRRIVKKGTCIESISNEAIEEAKITIANAGQDKTIVLDSNPFRLEGNTPVFGTGKWTLQSGQAGITFTADTQSNTIVSGMIPGKSYIFRWTISNGSCSNYDDVNIVTDGLTEGGVTYTNDQTNVCEGSNNGTVKLKDYIGSVLRWESSTDNVNWTAISNTNTELVFTNITATTRFRAVVRNGSGVQANSTYTEIVVKPKPPIANAGVDQFLCSTNKATLNANSAGSGEGEWTIVSSETTDSGIVITNKVLHTTTITGLVGGNTYTLLWTIKGDPCQATADSVTIKLDEITNNILSTANTTVCVGSAPFVIEGSTPLGITPAQTTYSWQSSTDNTTWTAVAGSDINLTVNPTITTYYRRTVSNGNCQNISGSFKITVLPVITNTISAGTSMCSVSTIQGALPTGGNNVYDYTWEQSTDNSTWTTIAGATNVDYLPLAKPVLTYYRRKVKSGSCAESTSNTISQSATLTTANAGSDETICLTDGTTFRLKGNKPEVGSGSWTLKSGPSAVTFGSSTQTNTTIVGLQAGTYEFTWEITNGGCVSKDDVKLVVEPISVGGTTTAVAPTTLCEGTNSGIINLSGHSGTIIRWESSTNNGGSWSPIANTTTSYSYSNLTATTQFRAVVKNGLCSETFSSSSTIVVKATLPIANAGLDQNLCSATTATLNGNAAGSGVGTWTLSSGPSSGVTITNSNLNTSTVTGLKGGNTYVFVWTISGSPCFGTADSVTIKIDEIRNNTISTLKTTLCSSAGAVTLSGSTPVGVSSPIYTWEQSLDDTDWTPVAGSGINLTVNPTVTTYYRRIVSNGPCQNVSGSLKITVLMPIINTITLATPGCTVSTISGNPPSGGAGDYGFIWEQSIDNLTWTTIAGATGSDYLPSAKTVMTYYRRQVTSGECENSISNTVAQSATVTEAFAGANETICLADAATFRLKGNSPVVGTGLWSVKSGPSSVTFGNDTQSNTTIGGLIAGTYTFTWRITSGTCVSQKDMELVVDAISVGGTTATAGQTIVCEGTNSGTINLTGHTGTITRWESSTNNGGSWSPLANTTTSYSYSNLTTTTHFRAVLKSGICSESFSASTTIVVKATPAVANAGADQNICSTTTATLNGNAAGSGIGTWTILSQTTGGFTITNPNLQSTTVTGLKGGNTYVFLWTITGSPCVATADSVTIIVGEISNNSISTAKATLCSNPGAIILSGSTPVGVTSPIYTWEQSIDNSNWTPLAGSAISLTVNPTAETYYRRIVSNGVCQNVSGSLKITVLAPIVNTITLATPGCVVSNISGNEPSGGAGGYGFIWEQSTDNLTWTTIAGATGRDYLPSAKTVMTYYRRQVTSGDCENSISNTVAQSASVTKALAGADEIICLADATTFRLKGNSPAVGAGLWTLTSGQTGIGFGSSSQSNTTITGLTVGTYTFKWTITSNGCFDEDEVNIKVDANSVGGITATAGQTTVCEGVNTGTIDLTGSTGSITRWESSTNNGVSWSPIANTVPNYTYNNLTTTTHFRAVLKSGACSETFSTSTTIIVKATPAIANAGLDQYLCGTTIATLNANEAGSGIGTWIIKSQTAGGATITNPNLNTSTITGLIGGNTYVLEWTVAGLPCASTADTMTIKIDEISNNILTTPKSSVCIGTGAVTIVGSVALGVSSPTYIWQSSPDKTVWTNISGATTISYALTPTVTAFYRRIVSNGTCQNTSGPIEIKVLDAIVNTISVPPVAVCAPSTVSGNNPTGGTGIYQYAWEQSIDNGANWTVIVGETNRDYVPTAITKDTKFRRLVTSGECGVSMSNEVSQNAVPTVANAGASETICVGTAFKLKGNKPLAGTGKWTKTAGPAGSAFVDDTKFDTEVTGLVGAGTYTFKWTISSGSCSTNQEVVITTSAASVGGTTTSTDPQTVCSGANAGTISLTGQTGNVVRWESSTDGGSNWIEIANSNLNYSYKDLITTTRFRAVVKNGVCLATNSSVITINVKPVPVVANAGIDQNLCSTTTATLNANSAGSDVGTWTLLSGPSVGVNITNINSSTTTVTGLVSAQNYVFKWTITGAPCVTTEDTVTIRIEEITNNLLSTDNPTICAGTGAITIKGTTPVGVASPIYIWQTSTDAITWSNIPGETGANYTLTPSVGETYFRRIVSNGSCQNISSPFIIKVWGPVVNTISAPTASCVPNIITGNSASGGSGSYVYSWESSTDGGTTWSTIVGASGKDYLPPTIAVTTQYRRIVVSGECARTVSFPVSQNPTVTTPNAGEDEIICIDGTAFKLKANQPVTGVGKWTQISGVAGAVFTDASKHDTQVSGLVGGQDYVFRWTISKADLSCPLADDVKIKTYSVSKGGTTESLEPNSVCQGVNAGKVNLTNYEGDILRWETSTDGVNWTAVIPNNTNPIQSYLNLNTTTRYRAVVKNGACNEALSSVFTVTVKPKPVVPNAGPDQNICSATMITLNGNSAGLDLGTWTLIEGTPVTFSNPNAHNSVVSGLKSGQKYKFRWTITGDPCLAAFDEIEITVDEITENIINAANSALCAGSGSLTIKGSLPNISGGASPIYSWQSSVTGLAWIDMVGENSQDLVVSPAQTTFYRRIVSSLTCSNPSSLIKIEVVPVITNNTISNISPICADSGIIGSTPLGGKNSYSYSWEASTDGGANWTPIAGENGRDYKPLSSGFFRRVVTSGVCVDATPGVAIQVKRLTAEFTFTKDASCPNFVIDAANVVAIHSPDNEIYEWYADGVLIGNGQIFPGYTIVEQKKNVEILLRVSNSLGCVYQEFKHTFSTKSAIPIPVFTQDETISCGPATINFTNLTPNINSPSFRWTITDGANSQSKNTKDLVHTFQPDLLGGVKIYTVKLEVTTGCGTEQTTSTVEIRSQPLTPSFFDNVINGCNPEVAFTNTSVGSASQYSFDFGDGNTYISTNKNEIITHTYTVNEEKEFTIQMIAENGCGVSNVVSRKIRLRPSLITMGLEPASGSSLIGNAPLDIKFKNKTIGAVDYIYEWGDNTSNAYTKSADDIRHVFTKPGTYTVKLLASNECNQQAISLTVTVVAIPIPAFVVDKQRACGGSEFSFKNASQNATRYEWDFGDGGSSTEIDPKHTFSTAKEFYDVTLTAYNALGLKVSTTKSKVIQIQETPAGNFTVSGVNITSDNTIEIPNKTFKFTNNTVGGTQFVWRFGNGSVSSQKNIEHTYDNIGSYVVSLEVRNEFNCTLSTSQTVTIKDVVCEFYLPNAFLPESDDVLVNRFKGIGVGIQSYLLVVTNKFGQELWSTSSLTEDGKPLEGWDGTYKGQAVPDGTYFWKAVVELKNGETWKGMTYDSSPPKTSGVFYLLR
ncbi:MAG: PKD domain-containing protein [Sphingobacteriaceae bacterium]|nr:PKD domain-containing protein [Sphingobacteriaceae bacterium]